MNTPSRPKAEWCNAAAHLAWALFLMLFLSELDRYLVRQGLMPGPGVAMFFAGVALAFGVHVGATAAQTMARSGTRPSMATILAACAAGSRSAGTKYVASLSTCWPFWLAFLLAALICVGQSFRWPDTSLRDATRVGIALAVGAGMALLATVPHLRRYWRVYLGVALACVCISVWVDAWLPGTFSSRPWRAAGFGVNANQGAHLINMLAVALLAYRRRTLVDFGILLVAGISVFLTLSRGGLVAYLLLAAGYCLLTGWRLRSWRAGGVLAVALAGLLTFGGWASMQTLPMFEGHHVAKRLDVTLNPLAWFMTQAPSEEKYDKWRRMLERRYGSYGRVEDDRVSQPTGTSESPASKPLANIPHGEPVYRPRIMRMLNAWDAVVVSPWLGHGSGFNVGEDISAHNMILAFWVDYGIGGALAYVAMLATAFWFFGRRRFWPGVFLVAIVTVWSASSHNVLDGRPAVMLLGLLIGLAEKLEPGKA